MTDHAPIPRYVREQLQCSTEPAPISPLAAAVWTALAILAVIGAAYVAGWLP